LANSDLSGSIPDRDKLQSVLDEFGILKNDAVDLKPFQARGLKSKLYKEALRYHSILARVSTGDAFSELRMVIWDPVLSICKLGMRFVYAQAHLRHFSYARKN
jgi:hypothetical protein